MKVNYVDVYSMDVYMALKHIGHRIEEYYTEEN